MKPKSHIGKTAEQDYLVGSDNYQRKVQRCRGAVVQSTITISGTKSMTY